MKKLLCTMTALFLGMSVISAITFVAAQEEGIREPKTEQQQTGQAPSGPGDMRQSVQAASPGNTGLRNNMVRAETMLGQQVVDRNGEEIGEVEEVFIDRQSGRVGHLVVAVGGFLGMGEELYIVPWDKVNPQTDALQLNIDQQTLEDAPTLTANEFEQNEGFDYDWVRESYEYYDYQPEWFKQYKP